jgi:hypothetical protein
MSLTFDFNNLPDEYERLFNSLPYPVQYALRYAHRHGYTMNDVFVMANNAQEALRNLTPEQVAQGIGAAVGGAAYIAADTGGPATIAGFQTASGIGSTIARSIYDSSRSNSPVPTEIAVGSDAEITPAQTNLPASTQISPNLDSRVSTRNTRRTLDMGPEDTNDITTLAGEPAAKRGKRETSVRYNAKAEMGIFTETRTAYLPVTFYLSINRPRLEDPIPLYIRMDWPHNILSRNILVKQFLPYSDAKFHVRTPGISNDMAMSNYRRTETGATWQVNALFHEGASTNKQIWNIGQLNPFPSTIKGSVAAALPTADGAGTMGYSSSDTIVDAACVPAYRKWYAKQYQYAHVMETDYKITYTPCESSTWSNIHVFEGMDVTSSNNTDVIPTDREYEAVQHWPSLKTHKLYAKSQEVQDKPYVISGTWRDNDFQKNRMVANEEDITTWTKLGATDFTGRDNGYREDMVLLNYMNPEGVSTCFNVRVDLKYKVQFKDLANTLRWLGSGSAISLSSADCIQVPTPTNGASGPTQNPERVYSNGVIPY